MGIRKVTYVMLTTEIYPCALWSVMEGFQEEGESCTVKAQYGDWVNGIETWFRIKKPVITAMHRSHNKSLNQGGESRIK